MLTFWKHEQQAGSSRWRPPQSPAVSHHQSVGLLVLEFQYASGAADLYLPHAIAMNRRQTEPEDHGELPDARLRQIELLRCSTGA
jgi:hypothetical protein